MNSCHTSYTSCWNFVMGLFGGEQHFIYYISYIYIATSLLLMTAFQFVSAPYGRYARSGWGLGIPPRLAWLLQELPSLVIPVFLLVLSDCPKFKLLPNKIILGLFLLHYFHRTFIYSLLIRGGKDTPLVTFLLAVVFCSVNGYLQGRYLLNFAHFGSNWLKRPSFYLGIALFAAGMFINIQCDAILRNIRKPGEKGYKIPRGYLLCVINIFFSETTGPIKLKLGIHAPTRSLFEYVSGANFLGEIIEWCGFAVASWTLPALAFAVMTASNIGPRACQHHKWYKQKFEDYPKNRKAVIPFIL